MEHLLVGGAQSVGKSENIYTLVRDFLIPKGFQIIAGTFPATFGDFKALFEGVDKNGKTVRIIVNTATDTVDIINDFKKFSNSNLPADILISSVRDDNFWPRKEFFTIMGIVSNVIEVPLAKITRRGANFNIALTWYQEKNYKLLTYILESSPFNL